ncbi:MAG: pyridoxine 5'-phosphate synthase [Erythrobacter sp.]|nr:pyridoxine 5'-phosphate synthase [Erythrobacter sp.]
MSMTPPLRLGVNIDHVATIRNARGGDHPDPVRAAQIVASVGGDGITAHLREDRRHIRDADLRRIQEATDLPLNLEMAATEEMLQIALRHAPHAACIVPEKREERTTEGGLDAAGLHNTLTPIVGKLRDAGIRVSLFIEANERQLDAALRLGVPVVEFHTGEYAHAHLDGDSERMARELKRVADMAALAAKNGIEPHAGHGLTYENVQPIAAIPQLAELNIGHYLVGEAVFVGLERAVRHMRELMDEAR